MRGYNVYIQSWLAIQAIAIAIYTNTYLHTYLFLFYWILMQIQWYNFLVCVHCTLFCLNRVSFYFITFLFRPIPLHRRFDRYVRFLESILYSIDFGSKSIFALVRLFSSLRLFCPFPLTISLKVLSSFFSIILGRYYYFFFLFTQTMLLYLSKYPWPLV